jgi:hypothetical protein
MGQDYAIAWWYGTAPPLVVQGDYDGDQIVNAQDYTVWRGNFDGNVTPGTGADGNGNGVIDGADYVVWRNNVTSGSGTTLASVPEPTAIGLAFVALMISGGRRHNARRRAHHQASEVPASADPPMPIIFSGDFSNPIHVALVS